MGRGILSMKLIANDKSRKSTFFKRKKSLMKKAFELSTLCDVRTCVLVYGPTQNDRSAPEFQTWPANRDEIKGMIGAYKAKILEKQPKMALNLCDFFSDRKKKIEAEISKLRKEIAETRLPKWDDSLDYLLEDQLRILIDELDSKISAATRRIDFLESVCDRGTSSNQALVPILKPESFFEEQIQWSFHHQIATTNQYHLQAENSVPTMPNIPVQDMDLFQFLSGLNVAQMKNEPPNFSMAPSPWGQSPLPLSHVQYADQTTFASDSQMMNSSFGEWNQQQFDYMNYEALMKNNYYNF